MFACKDTNLLSRQKAVLSLVGVVLFLSACTQQGVVNKPSTEVDNRPNPESGIWGPPVGQDAPEDAYFDGDQYAYYGSDNPWNLRFFYGYFDDWEGRRGQRMILDIMDAKYGEAENYARMVMNREPDNLEAVFNLAITLAQQNRIDESMTFVKLAVDKGLPFGRFLAGPRELMRPLHQSEAFQEYSKNFNIPVVHGPMLGRVTTTAASFWVRTSTEIEIQVLVSNTSDFNSPKYSSFTVSTSDDDFTAIVSIDDLMPNTQYYYKVLADDNPVENIGIRSFMTYPEPGSEIDYSIAFGGCAGFVSDHERIWETIHGKNPRSFLAMGDNVYINMVNHTKYPFGMQHYTYYRRQSRPEFTNLTASTSVYAIWDDHEFTDDIWMGPFTHKPHWKMPLLNQFKENWINPMYGTDDFPGVWHSYSIGDVDVFMLDGRFYRTNPYAKEPSKTNGYAEFPTMLGPEQKAWLFEELKKSTGTFKIIASPVPFTVGASDALDTWNGYPEEREEIFTFIEKNKIDGVVLIAADRHRSDAWKIERPSGYPLYEFISGRLTNEHLHPTMDDAIFSYNDKQSFGLLTFLMADSDPALTYEIYSIDDEKVFSMTLRQSDLKHP